MDFLIQRLKVPRSKIVFYDLKLEPQFLAAKNVAQIIFPKAARPAEFLAFPVEIDDEFDPERPLGGVTGAGNALETIQGKVAGVTIIPSGQPGGGTNLMLRTPTFSRVDLNHSGLGPIRTSRTTRAV